MRFLLNPFEMRVPGRTKTTSLPLLPMHASEMVPCSHVIILTLLAALIGTLAIVGWEVKADLRDSFPTEFGPHPLSRTTGTSLFTGIQSEILPEEKRFRPPGFELLVCRSIGTGGDLAGRVLENVVPLSGDGLAEGVALSGCNNVDEIALTGCNNVEEIALTGCNNVEGNVLASIRSASHARSRRRRKSLKLVISSGVTVLLLPSPRQFQMGGVIFPG